MDIVFFVEKRYIYPLSSILHRKTYVGVILVTKMLQSGNISLFWAILFLIACCYWEKGYFVCLEGGHNRALRPCLWTAYIITQQHNYICPYAFDFANWCLIIIFCKKKLLAWRFDRSRVFLKKDSRFDPSRIDSKSQAIYYFFAYTKCAFCW